jgi:hypothetical protein
MKREAIRRSRRERAACRLAIFDIVNGFLNRCRGGIVVTDDDLRVQVLRARYHHKSIKLIIWLR